MLGGIGQTGKRIISALLPGSLMYRQGERPNILLFSSRRGGSTYLAGLIACEPSMRFVDQPFDMTPLGLQRNPVIEAHLPHKLLSQFISLSDSDADKVRSYMRLLLDGGLREMSPPYLLPRNRTILKIVNAIPLVDWFAEQFEVLIIYLVRHPIPQALSVVKTDWPITAQAYLENPVFSGKYLSPSQRQAGASIMQKGTHLEKAVLNWVLENLYPLKYASRIDLTLTYEELVLFPTMAIDLVARTLELENVAGMRARVDTPSRSSRFSDRETNDAIARSDRESLVGRWLSKVDNSTRDRIGGILNAFDILEYSVDGPLPNERLCHFRGFASESEVTQ